MKIFQLFIFFLLVHHLLIGQNVKNYIIKIEGERVYLDLTSLKIKDKVSVFTDGGSFIHPVSKKKISKEPEFIANLEIISVHKAYSVAKVIPAQAISELKTGMEVFPVESSRTTIATKQPSSVSADKIAVVVAPAQVNDVVGIGYFGNYVADVLMEQLMLCNRIKLLDRSVLQAQIDETNLTGQYIDPKTAIRRGKIAGAKYIIQITMQKPDVVNIRTGIPLASVMGAAQAISGKNIGAQYMSNAQVGTLKAAVNITTRVVDLQTGEVLFMCSGAGKAQGKSQLSLEYGALGGAELNGGADGFKQTVTGKAIQKAFMIIGHHLNEYFNGNTDKKVIGSATGFGNFNQNLRVQGLTRLYLGTERLDDDGIQMAFSNEPELFFQYKKAKKLKTYSWITLIGGIGIIGAGTPDCIEGDASGSIMIGVGVLSTLGGIYMNVLSRKKARHVAETYNAKQQNQFSLGINNKGLSLCFTF